jgi:SanA protein
MAESMAPALSVLAATGVTLVAATMIGSNALVHWSTRRYVFSEVSAVPEFETAIVLGCAPHLRDGQPNFYFEARLDAAAQLYAAGRVAHFVVSGGPLRRGAPGGANGSECDAMVGGLVARGVPRERIALDVAGTRTRRSAQRARDAFGLRTVVFVSQAFHARRAVFLGRRIGLDAVAYIAPSPALSSHKHWKVLLRETLSRTRAVLESAATKKNVPGR